MKGRMKRHWARGFVRIMVIWLLVALLFWMWYLLTQRFQAQLLYPYLWLGLVGIPIWLLRGQLRHLLQRWRLNGFLKFALLGYAAVLLEEMFAALVNNLAEGFSLELYLQRIGQFWALNVLAFTGLIVGWYILLRLFAYSAVERFYLAGLFGLFAERTIVALPTNPLAFFLFAPLIIFTYGLILTPAMLSLSSGARHHPSWIIRYPLALLVPFVCSVPPVFVLQVLRSSHPGWFPPRKFVP